MKTCFKCNRVLPLSEFYRHPMMADGHLNKCRDCAKKDAHNRIERKRDAVAAYERRRAQTPERRAAVVEAQRRMRKAHPEKYLARTAVRVARRRSSENW